MATTLEKLPPVARARSGGRDLASPLDVLLFALSPLSSLKLTLVLLGMAIFLVFVGTLAQAQAGMWEAVSQYFWSWGAWVELQVFFPKPWFPQWHEAFEPWMGFPFPGGKLIGVAMMTNLLAAHLVRFRSQARGTRLLAGILALAVGVLLTYIVVALGDFRQGLRDQPLVSWETTAILTLLAACGASAGLLVAGGRYAISAYHGGEKRRWVQAGLAIAGALVSLIGCFLLWMFLGDMSALRILWQLIQGTVAGVVLLGGCWLLFDKRAGVVLLHGGVALMMFSQLFVSLWAVEERMSIDEGDTAVYAIDTRVAELALVAADEESEKHVVVAQRLLEQAAGAKDPAQRIISHDNLPVDLELVRFYRNSGIADPKKEADEPNLATAGMGEDVIAVQRPVGAGASSDSEVDMPAAYIKLLEKGTGKDLGTYVASTRLNSDMVRIGDATYDFSLRFKRTYKPYNVTLKDVKKEDYPGSDTPRNYESVVQFTDGRYDVDRSVQITMNNPFRYLGETFYQSGYFRDPRSGRETTTLQVVSNTGWMTPYVACMIVAVGLLYQFTQTLMKFVVSEKASSATIVSGKPAEVAKRAKQRRGGLVVPQESWKAWFRPSWFALGMLALTVVIVLYGFAKPKPKSKGFDLYAFGKLPVVDQGRAKPLDSLARETLLGLSNKTTVKGENGKSLPAIEWLLMTIATPDKANKLEVIRIEHPEVASALDLPTDREGMRYSMEELREKSAEFNKQLEVLREKDKEKFTAFDTKFAELSKRTQGHMRIYHAFVPAPLELPSAEELEEKDPKARQQVFQAVDMLQGFSQMLEETAPPLAVPVSSPAVETIARDKKWIPFSIAAMFAEIRQILPDEHAKIDEPTAALAEIFAAYAEGDPDAFNERVAKYSAWLERNEPDFYAPGKVSAESYMNHIAPFGWTQGILLYFLALIVSFLGLLMFRRQVGSAAFWMLVVALVLHTFWLGMRIYISGRPPVTNLYSSAVFIGWFVVLGGLVLEAAFRLGVGNVVASIAGLAGLLIADKLSLNERDTIGVMQAVLDTQFWLATHVVCITIGYGATFLAGLLGVVYIFMGLFTPNLNARDGKLLGRMIYGVVCFALFFSFVGTVLGGLWADDSWGRFWGWDPKENGALIIVLWNAFILHARWDKLANERGMAVLAVVGNIVTCWSWFGTNQLGIGLHSYGFTSGVLVALGVTVLLHLGIVGLGLVPKSLWWSYRERERNPLADV